MDKTELKQNYIRFHKTADGKHKGVSLEFANEIEMDSFLDEYAQQVSREVAVRFMAELDDTYDEETPFEDRLKEWGEVFDIWWKQKQNQQQ